jgi:SAM-dependent methyltransferase
MSSDWARHAERNRRAWNEIAEVRSTSYEGARDASFFRGGGVTIDDPVLAAVGDPRGLRLLHLMCATGEETLSWAVLGADVAGIDISDREVDIARRKANAAGVPVRFVAADVGALPSEFASGDFDLVYTASGVLAWLPDLSIWAAAVARALRRGGRFVLWEEHPVAQSLIVDDTGHVIVEDDYFAKEPFEGVGMRHFPGGASAAETNVEFGWTLGDVVSSVAQAGLRIERLTEYPASVHERWRFGDGNAAAGIPARFLLVAQKDQ